MTAEEAASEGEVPAEKNGKCRNGERWSREGEEEKKRSYKNRVGLFVILLCVCVKVCVVGNRNRNVRKREMLYDGV